MSNKITNDDSFQNYIGKYISLTENGVKKKYYVSEISKSSFLSNVSILQGVSGTDFNFTSAGVQQKCDTCDFPCVSAIPVIELIFPGKKTTRDVYQQGYLLQKDYIDEIHCPIINDYKTATIYTSVLSADFNVVWLIPSNRTDINISTDDVFIKIKESYPSLFTSFTTSFSAFFFDPAYYYENDINEFRIDHIYANNPGAPTYVGYNPSWFWCDFYNDGLANATYYTSRILYKKIVQNSNGSYHLSCYPWLQYELTPSEWGGDSSVSTPRGDYVTPFPPSLYPDSQQVTGVFLDLNPCSVPNVEFYQYNIQDYYTDFLTYLSYLDSYESPYYPFPFLRKIEVYDSCSLSNSNFIYVGRDTAKRDNGINYTGTIFYSNSTADVFSGDFYYSPSQTYKHTILNGIQISYDSCF